ncbi:MAG TPA: B-box zinc finger protein [Terriglobia bacterium]|nr:B-box zinc finger protein [Terriglobia bacterium]
MKPTPQTAMGQLVLFGVLPYVVFGLWLLWGVMSFVLYVVARAGKQNAAIVRDALAARGNPFPAGTQLPHGSHFSGALDRISVNVPHPPVAQTRQTGSVFGLTLGQEARAVHPLKSARTAQSGVEASSGTMDTPVWTVGSSGTNEAAAHNAWSPREGQRGKSEPSVYTYEAPGLPPCPECGVRPVIFYCTRHHQPLCLECVVRHDRAYECTYVPGWRGEKPGMGGVPSPSGS